MGKLYVTNEHFFQSARAKALKDSEEIRKASTPAKAKRLGRSVVIRPDWEYIKLDVMYLGLRLKFSHTNLKKQLLSTQEALLIEGNKWGDTYWGVCCGEGQNQLGLLLMRLREELSTNANHNKI